MIMKKFYFILTAAASIALASCTNDEYLGGSPGTGTANENGAIVFGGNAGKLTRATSNTGATAADMLDGQMKIFGVKKKSTTYTNVFSNYVVWSATDKTASNPDQDWEYVGASGKAYGTTTTAGTLPAAQYIKYWDYSTDEYHFVAGSPVKAFTYNIASGEIASATVTDIGGHINPNDGDPGTTVFEPVYIADPVIVPKAAYNQDVTFNFTRQQTFVRVGVFETIPGYSISDIKFYKYNESSDAWTTDKSNNVTLASKTADYFSGASNATATITYTWTGAGAPNYTYAYAGGLTQQKNWYGGKFASGVPAETSTAANLYGTDKDMAVTTGYFPVLPMSSATAQPLLVKCDYTLTALDNSETIDVTGATAAIPAAFTLWKPNTSYTYLFKISDNTNGTTGTPDTDPEGLFPITFDAVVIAETNGTELGNITTVATPSITTYQDGSVTAAGIKYVKDKAIYFTAQNNETGATYNLTTGTPGVKNVEVYKLGIAADANPAPTEADLILTRPADGKKITTTILATATKVGKWNVPAKSGSFTPDATGYYAIEYQTAAGPATYAYKIVKVEE